MDFIPDSAGLEELADTVVISVIWQGDGSPTVDISNCTTFEAYGILAAVNSALLRYNVTRIAVNGDDDDDEDDDD